MKLNETRLMEARERLAPAAIERSPLVATVDPEKCVRCGICVQICPHRALYLQETVLVAVHVCNGCGECVDECPTEAIELVDR